MCAIAAPLLPPTRARQHSTHARSALTTHIIHCTYHFIMCVLHVTNSSFDSAAALQDEASLTKNAIVLREVLNAHGATHETRDTFDRVVPLVHPTALLTCANSSDRRPRRPRLRSTSRSRRRHETKAQVLLE